MTGQTPNMTVNHSVLLQSLLMQRKHTAGCHQHRGGEGIACSKIMLLNGVVWSVKSRRAQNGPLGNSKFEIGFGGQTVTYLNPLASTTQIDSNQLSAFPVTLNQSSSLLSRIVWSMVSKAAERSSNVSAVTLPAFFDARILLWMFSRVEWNFLHADWCWGSF